MIGCRGVIYHARPGRNELRPYINPLESLHAFCHSPPPDENPFQKGPQEWANGYPTREPIGTCRINEPLLQGWEPLRDSSRSRHVPSH
jgi:hypothetical protein